METLHQHQIKPRVYYQIGSGWITDRMYHQKIENKTTKNK